MLLVRPSLLSIACYIFLASFTTGAALLSICTVYMYTTARDTSWLLPGSGAAGMLSVRWVSFPSPALSWLRLVMPHTMRYPVKQSFKVPSWQICQYFHCCDKTLLLNSTVEFMTLLWSHWWVSGLHRAYNFSLSTAKLSRFSAAVPPVPLQHTWRTLLFNSIFASKAEHDVCFLAVIFVTRQLRLRSQTRLEIYSNFLLRSLRTSVV